jgi:hypothetical protein
MLKPVFNGKFSNLKFPRFVGSFLGDFMGFNVKFRVFEPQKVLPYPKRHLPVYFMKLTDKLCRLHPGSRTPKRCKMPSRMYMLGVCQKLESDPQCKFMKLGMVGLIRYVITLTAVGPHRLTGFDV